MNHRSRRFVAAVVTGAVALGVLAVAASGAILGVANGGHLVTVGPTSSDNGFPVWYKDDKGVRLQPCLDLADPNCAALTPSVVPNPAKPVSFPDNFPGEFFYQLAQTTFTLPLGGKVLGAFNVEGSFTSPTAPSAGTQVTFGRIRIRVDGLKAGASYTVTHPYGVDKLTATNTATLNFTEDIGVAAGQFGGVLGSRVGPFLKWDPAVSPAAPAGYTGDGVTAHAITGSPYGTNLLRIEGPNVGVGAPAANECPTPSNDCIQSTQFVVQGKLATTAGVAADRATYNRAADGSGTIDVFAGSDGLTPQSIQVSGTGVPITRLRGENGDYTARIAFTGAPADKLTVTNVGDVPASSTSIGVTDLVSARAVYDADAQTLTVNADSSDKATNPKLTATGLGDLGADGSLQIANRSGAPASVTVKSAAGGAATVPVTVTGAGFAPIPVQAFAGPDQEVATGAAVTLDGSGSTGPVTSYSWKQVAGTTVSLSGAATKAPSFTAPSGAGTLTFELTADGSGGPATDRVDVRVLSGAGAPVTKAGADQTVTQGAAVTLDGSATTGATTYSWTQVSGPAVTLQGATTAKPTFTFPRQNVALTFRLTATGAGGSTTDDVVIATKADTLTLTKATVSKASLWRVEGTSSVAGPGVTITIHSGPTLAGEVVGTAQVDALGIWKFKNTVSVVGSTTRVSVESSAGGQLLNQVAK